MSRKPLSRRFFLGGAGVMLGLPMLEAMLPSRRAHANPELYPNRLIIFYVPNGIHMPAWTPQNLGAGYDLPPILAPLEDDINNVHLRDDTLVISGLRNDPAKPEGPGDHAAGTAGFLTCKHINKSETDIQNGVSMDQLYAASVADQTAIASLQLGIEGGTNQGNCDSGYGCAYSRNISWADVATPLPKITTPQLAFDIMFGGYDPMATAEQIARRKTYRLSVLDSVKADAQALLPRLGASDKAKLDEYLTGVRDLEMRVDTDTAPVCDTSGFSGSFSDYPEQVSLMLDLMVLAIQCDSTRVISFMLGNAASGRSYDFIGVGGAHHDISHHGSDPTNFQKLTQIDTWEVQQYARLLQKMKNVPEGDGTLLDHSMVYFSSEIEDGNTHAHQNLPVLLAGGACGGLSQGRHVQYADQPLANLYTSMLNILGVNATEFGDDGTGPLTGL